MSDPHEDTRPHPRRLEDVAGRLRTFTDRPGPLGQEVRPQSGLQDSSIPALDMSNVSSIMRTPVRNSVLGVQPWQPHLRFSCPSVPGSPPPHHHSTSRRHPHPGGCRLACTHLSLRDHGCGRWPFPPTRTRRPPRDLAERGAVFSAPGHLRVRSRALFLLFLAAVTARAREGRDRTGEVRELGWDDELRRRRRPELIQGVEVLKGHRPRVRVHGLLVDR
jgi:hypothetical protein